MPRRRPLFRGVGSGLLMLAAGSVRAMARRGPRRVCWSAAAQAIEALVTALARLGSGARLTTGPRLTGGACLTAGALERDQLEVQLPPLEAGPGKPDGEDVADADPPAAAEHQAVGGGVEA